MMAERDRGRNQNAGPGVARGIDDGGFGEELGPLPGERRSLGVRTGAITGAGASRDDGLQGDLLGDPVDLKSGHRDRLRQRFLRGGSAAVADYELMELVLFRAIPRRDVKDLAKTLIARFGSFAEVVNAPEPGLREVSGIGDAIITELLIVRAAALEVVKVGATRKPVMSSWAHVIDYVTAAQARESVEQFRVLYLDKKNKLIADEVHGRGTIDHTPVYVREVVKRALELGSTAMILVHNHPSGDPTPSRADIDMTKLIMEAGRPLGVSVHDHIIVGREGHASLKALRLI